MPACEPFLPFLVRAVGVTERALESPSSNLRFLLEGLVVFAVPFFLMTLLEEGAGRFLEGAGTAFGSLGDVTLSATLAVRLARRPRSLAFASSMALRVATP